MSTKKAMKYAAQYTGKYAAAPGAMYSDAKAQLIGCELEQMESDGIAVTTDSAWERAKSPESALHDHIDWDQPTAAKNWQMQQVRQIINHLRVVVETPDGSKTLKAAFSIRIASEDDGAMPMREYVNVFRIESDPEARMQVYNEALGVIRWFTEKYEAIGLNEFAPIYAFVHSRNK